jgi:hypothetical protein
MVASLVVLVILLVAVAVPLTVLSLNAVGPLFATCGLLLLVIAQAIRSRS